MNPMHPDIRKAHEYFQNFLDNMTSNQKIHFLDQGLEHVESILDSEIQESIKDQTLTLLQTYTKNFLKACRKIHQNPIAHDAEEINAVLRAIELLRSYGEHFLSGDDPLLEELLDVHGKIKSLLKEEEREMTLDDLANNIIKLSKPEQDQAVALLEKLGLSEATILKLIKRQNDLRKSRIKNNLETAINGVLQEADDRLLDLILEKLHLSKEHNADVEIVKDYLARLSVVPTANDTKKQEGHTVPVVPITEPTYSQKGKHVYEYRVHHAVARMTIQGSSYIILKGSTAMVEENASMPNNHRQIKNELVVSGTLVLNRDKDLYVFKDKVSFNSPSAASGVVSGSSTNGWLCFNIHK